MVDTATQIEDRRLGATGVRVSEVAFGTWRFGKVTDGVLETDREEAHRLLDAYAAHGGNFIDTANTYGDGDSERWIGEWLADRDRENYFVASKTYWSVESRVQENLSRKQIRAEIEGTLDRLDTDYVDLYYIHRWDDETPIEETMRTLNRLVEEGKVHYLGASTMAAWKLTRGLWESDVHDWASFDVTQPLFHAGYYEDIRDYLDVCIDNDLAVVPYSPLAGGFLTGKYERADPDDPEAVIAPDGSRGDFDSFFPDWYASERGWKVLDAVQAVAEEVEATPAQVALRWVMDMDAFTCIPIVGARTPEQIAENVGACDLSLTDAQHDHITDARYREDGRRWGH